MADHNNGGFDQCVIRPLCLLFFLYLSTPSDVFSQLNGTPDTLYQLKFNWNQDQKSKTSRALQPSEPEKYFSKSLGPLKGLTKPIQTNFLDLNWSFSPLKGSLNITYKTQTPFDPNFQIGFSSFSQFYSGFAGISENKYLSALLNLDKSMHSEAFISWQYEQMEFLTSIRLRNFYSYSHPGFNPAKDQVQIRFTYRF